MMEKIPVIIDTDPGIDDAAAICAACNCDILDIRLISTVAGNVDAGKTTSNALKIMKFLNKKIPVAKGCVQPLIVAPFYAGDVHGSSGMDGYNFPPLGENDKETELHSVEEMRKIITSSEIMVTIITLGALTNIALLLSMYPEVKNNINEIVIMGGSFSGGNVNSSAEFNIYADPHAAQIVINSGVRILITGLDVTLKALLRDSDLDKIRHINLVGEMLCGLFEHYRAACVPEGIEMHDSCAVAVVAKRELFAVRDAHVSVLTDGEGAGTTVGDFNLRFHESPNVKVCTGIDAEGFRKWFIEMIGKYNR